MSCDDAVNIQEFHYLQALESAATYAVADYQLHIINTDAKTMLTYTRVESVEGTPITQKWTVEALKNAAYTIEDLGEVQLVDGEYEHKYGDGASMVDKVGIVNVVLGDLDGDGSNDAAVILWWQSGGSGTFLYIAAVLNHSGTPYQAGILPLGDRVRPAEMSITDGAIILESLSHSPDDPMCCPSQNVIQTFALAEDALALISSKIVKPELIGVIWQWERYEDTAGKNDIVVDDPTRFTLEFSDDRTYKLQADCNQGSGGYTLDDNGLTLSPGPMTMAECEPNSLYDDYIRDLSDVVNYIFDGQKLLLNLKMDAGNMIFVKAE